MNPRIRRLIFLLVVSVLVIAAVVALSGERASSGSPSAPEPSVTTTEPQRDYVDTLQKSIDDAVALREQQERDFLKAVEYVQAVEAEQQRQAEAAAKAAAHEQWHREQDAKKAAAAKAAAAAAAKPVAPAASSSYSGDVWHDLAMCETGGKMDNPNTGNGYYGFFQFSLGTWQSVGGSGYPHEHSYGTQQSFAQKLQARSGWGQWPACSAKLGLR